MWEEREAPLPCTWAPAQQLGFPIRRARAPGVQLLPATPDPLPRDCSKGPRPVSASLRKGMWTQHGPAPPEVPCAWSGRGQASPSAAVPLRPPWGGLRLCRTSLPAISASLLPSYLGPRIHVLAWPVSKKPPLSVVPCSGPPQLLGDTQGTSWAIRPPGCP